MFKNESGKVFANLLKLLWLLLRLGLDDGGKISILSAERQLNEELKYRISTKVQQRIFSRLLINTGQKADELHVSPRYPETSLRQELAAVLSLQLSTFQKYSHQKFNF